MMSLAKSSRLDMRRLVRRWDSFRSIITRWTTRAAVRRLNIQGGREVIHHIQIKHSSWLNNVLIQLEKKTQLRKDVFTIWNRVSQTKSFILRPLILAFKIMKIILFIKWNTIVCKRRTTTFRMYLTALPTFKFEVDHFTQLTIKTVKNKRAISYLTLSWQKP